MTYVNALKMAMQDDGCCASAEAGNDACLIYAAVYAVALSHFSEFSDSADQFAQDCGYRAADSANL